MAIQCGQPGAARPASMSSAVRWPSSLFRPPQQTLDIAPDIDWIVQPLQQRIALIPELRRDDELPVPSVSRGSSTVKPIECAASNSAPAGVRT